MITSETQLFQFLQLLHSRVLSTFQYKGIIQRILNHTILNLRFHIYYYVGWCIKFATGVEMEIFAVCVITFEPIKIQTCSSLQNDLLNLSFVKDINTVGKKITRNSPTAAIYKFSFVSEQSII